MSRVISLVIPVYNESEGISDFHDKILVPELIKIKKNLFEIIYVNDGSKDNSLNILCSLDCKYKIKVINLSRNFGKEIAISAGIHNAKGEAIIILDADGQHPPSIIKDFIDKWQKNNAQVVIGVRESNQKEGAIKKIGSKVFYKLFNSSSGANIIPRSTDFRLIDQQVQKEFMKLSENNRITRGLIDWLGFKRDYIYFDSPQRLAGKASYSSKALFKLALNSFVSLSLMPLMILSIIGISITVLAMLVGMFIIIEQFLMHDPMNLNFTGSALLGIFITFLVGLVMTSQGVIAIYLSYVHTQSQNRPLYIIDSKNSKNI